MSLVMLESPIVVIKQAHGGSSGLVWLTQNPGGANEREPRTALVLQWHSELRMMRRAEASNNALVKALMRTRGCEHVCVCVRVLFNCQTGVLHL